MGVIIPDFRALDRIACVGDSLTDPVAGNGVSWYQYLDGLLRPSYSGSSPVAGGGGSAAQSYLAGWYRGPTFVNFGHSGDTTSDILARISTVYPLKPHGVILFAGVNNVTNGVAPATTSSDIGSIVANLRANAGSQLRWIMWVQPLCAGEQRPFGTNGFDTTPPAVDSAHTLVAHDAVIRSQASALGLGYCEFRTDAAGNGPWLTYETANNLGNAASGVLTIDGRHLTSAPGGSNPPSAGIGGGPFVAQQVLANCTVSA